MTPKHIIEYFLDPEENLSNKNVVLNKLQVDKLNEFFSSDLDFEFRKYNDCFCGFTLFFSFKPFVNKESKNSFLKTVWDMFIDYREKTYWHNWRGICEAPEDNLFAEGFLKLELGLIGRQYSRL